MKLLVISTVHIEPTSSAAGSRMLQLLELFLENGYSITYATTAGRSDHAYDLEHLGIASATIKVNDASFDAFAKAYQPTIVLFDRFMVEEQFGWRIAEHCPNALKILDTEDLHCLRKARQEALKEDRPFYQKDLVSDVAKREIASIYRCDLTIMISRFEMELLQDFFKVPELLLIYIPFLLDPLDDTFIIYEERQHFVSLGNFLHPPNWDATLELKKHIWPQIRKELPNAQIQIYGAYPSEKVWQLCNERDGFIVKGRAVNAREVIENSRVLLAPLRFGAGLKGKFIDAMQCGTPSVTTVIGAEGMQEGLEWSGVVEDDYDAFAKASIRLYKNKSLWQVAQQNGVQIINTNFQKSDFAKIFRIRINELLENLSSHRLDNFNGQMLLHHTMRSTKFMSKWIEEKNNK